MISASKDGKPMFRQGETGDWIGTFQGHKGAIWGVALNSDSDAKLAATASADFSAKIWNAVSGKTIHTYEHNHVVKTCDFNPASTHLVTGGMEKLVRIFDIERSDADPIKLAGHDSSIRRSIFYGNDTILSCSDDKSIRVWDIKSSQQVKKLDFPAIVYDMEISADQQTLTICYEKWVAFYNLKDFSLYKKFQVPTVTYSASLSSEQDGTSFVCAGEDFRLYRCDYETGSVVEMFRGHFGPVHSIRFSPDGELYASASEDGTLRLWQTHLGKQYGLWRAAPEPEQVVSKPVNGQEVNSVMVANNVGEAVA